MQNSELQGKWNLSFFLPWTNKFREQKLGYEEIDT